MSMIQFEGNRDHDDEEHEQWLEEMNRKAEEFERGRRHRAEDKT